MSNWQKYSLEDLAFYYNGKAFKPSDWKKEGVKIIRIEQLNNPNGFYDFYQGEFPEINKVENGDLLFSWSATLKVLIWKHGSAVLNQHLFKVVPKQFVDKHFLFFLLDYNMEKIGDTSHGSTMKHIKRGELEKFFVRVPDKTEQRQIATILSTADAVIEKTQAAIAKYKAIKQGMLQDLFTRGIDTTTGKLRPRYRDAPELYKESKLGWIPREWENCEMGKYISDNLYGPRFNAKDYHINGNVKTIRGTDFTKDGEILYNKAPKAQLESSLINSHKLEDGDIVIVTAADCGLTAVFKKPINDVEFIPSAYSVKYRFMKNVNPYFIKYFMTTDVAIRQVNKFVRQGTLGNLPGSDILGFNMIYPSTDEQNKIAERLLTIDKKLQTEQAFLHKQQQIKAGLMNDLLSGEKKVIVKKKLEPQTGN